MSSRARGTREHIAAASLTVSALSNAACVFVSTTVSDAIRAQLTIEQSVRGWSVPTPGTRVRSRQTPLRVSARAAGQSQGLMTPSVTSAETSSWSAVSIRPPLPEFVVRSRSVPVAPLLHPRDWFRHPRTRAHSMRCPVGGPRPGTTAASQDISQIGYVYRN